MTTENLGLPEIAVGQSQPEVTVNTALSTLDVLVQTTVTSMALTAPPGSPAQGVAYIPKATATGAWLGKENTIARYRGTAWSFTAPKTGWRIENLADGKQYVYVTSTTSWRVVEGYLAKSVAAGGTISLTTDEARAKILNFTGALSANVVVEVPAVAAVFLASNNTTGGFSVTVKTQAGTGPTLANVGSALLFCDGVNVYSNGGSGVDGGVMHLAGAETATGLKTMTGGITGLPTPTSASDAATKAYADGVASGLSIKNSVKTATGSNVTLSGTQTLDGIACVANDRVLLTGQSTASQNGIWLVQSGAWTRPTDFATGSNASGAFTFVETGTLNGGDGFVEATSGTVTVDTTAQTWTQFSGAGQITAGTALSKSGDTLNVTLGTTGSSAAAGNDSRITGALQASSNLSDVASAATARSNIGAMPSAPTITTDTTTARTLVIGDRDTYIRMTNAAANTVTVPPNSSVAFSTGSQVNIRQGGAGNTTIAQGAGVTINATSLVLKGQHATATLIKVATDTWDLMGSLST